MHTHIQLLFHLIFQTNNERVNEVLLIFRTEAGDSDNKESACNMGVSGSIPWLGRSLGEGMAVHSSILAWRIPWTEPGGLQSMGSQRIGHN